MAAFAFWNFHPVATHVIHLCCQLFHITLEIFSANILWPHFAMDVFNQGPSLSAEWPFQWLFVSRPVFYSLSIFIAALPAIYQISSFCSKISSFLISSSALSKTWNFLAWPFSSFIITTDQLNMRVQTCSNELAITSYKSYKWGKSHIMSMLNKSSHRIDPCSTPEKSYCQTLSISNLA